MNKEIEALLIERKGYLMRGLKSRAAEVEKCLQALGYKAFDEIETSSVEPAVERSIKAKVKKRKV